MSNKKIVWKTINWTSVRRRVSKYQQRIFEASLNSDGHKVHGLQKRLINSLDAKLLAVLRVTTENKGKKTKGVDRKLYLTAEEKSKLVRKIRVDGKSSPIRRVYIPKPGTDVRRPLGIPIVEDRAKQALLLLALEPEWEAKFESNSYGFRPGRSCHDAIEAIYLSIRNHRSNPNFNRWILDADLKGCFDNINHEYLLKKLATLPEIRVQVEAWLKAGIFEGYLTPEEYYSISPNELGTPQGGVLSPFLANVALHGMENHLKDWICSKPNFMSNRGRNAKRNALTVIRYADDFVIIHPDKNILLEAKAELESWFGNSSQLKFNQVKTNIVSIKEGFNFLGFTIIAVIRNGMPRAKIVPSRKAQLKLLSKTRNIIQTHRNVSSYVLISKLRPVIIGWGNYYKFSECKDCFHRLTHFIFHQIRAWVFRRDRRHGRCKVKQKYFPSGKTYSFDGSFHQDNWILVGKEKDKYGRIRENYLPHLVWLKSRKFIKVKGNASV